ncbi:MAG: hypothetical protein GXO15_04045, partial [Crenarchaeota archaeon]|nr:hypothetical protein [Thermoproteota archaeon]
LADSSTVLCAEPILAAALLAAARPARVGGGWRAAGYTGRPGGYQLLARRPGGKRCRILVPGSLYALALSGLTASGVAPGGPPRRLVVPDPALVRKRVFDERPAYGRLSGFLREVVLEASSRALRASEEEACRERGLMLVEYRFDGLLEAYFNYIC